ncbi:hypothetical protein CC80DRAFT_511206 [Byssothecium circinans]|uniref:Ubiquitin 3 binding protein But2 C-terminal domain-containing protein n=1 Tax=Byssothecium circinans TaxID=147558 RepID=A0A6A5TAC4_9PLEO|nr:hypothetical protein CC80DRAFT_511206 [Byssothecium circinans]
MKVFSLIATLASIVATSTPLSTPLQNPLNDARITREKVPGNNPAFYTLLPSKDQMFRVRELTMSPQPPLKQRVFFYLSGFIIPKYPLPPPSHSLINATLTLRMRFTDGDTESPNQEWNATRKITEFPFVSVRRVGIYGGPLLYGWNEVVGDVGLMHDPWNKVKTREVEAEAEARMGVEGEGEVGEVLWGFGARFKFAQVWLNASSLCDSLD